MDMRIKNIAFQFGREGKREKNVLCMVACMDGRIRDKEGEIKGGKKGEEGG